MTIPTFPTAPRVLLSGYTITPVPNMRRTEFESGPARQVPAATRQIVERDVQLHCCDAACYAALKDFVQTTLKGGALWFLWSCPDRAAQGLANPIRARIKGGAVKYVPQNREMTTWLATMTLESWAL